MVLSLVTKTRCLLLPRSNRTHTICFQAVLVTTMVTFFQVYPYPYHKSGLLQVGLISGSIVLHMILHKLHGSCYCGGGGNHLLDLPPITAINALFLPCIQF
jgi:hypothetical protein